MSDRERTDYRARHMGFVFQFYNLMPVLTAVENVELPLLIARVPAEKASEKALDALELVGLRAGGPRPGRAVRRRAAAGHDRALARERPGDRLGRRAHRRPRRENAAEIVQLMRQLNRERGLTFLIVTHDSSVGARPTVSSGCSTGRSCPTSTTRPEHRRWSLRKRGRRWRSSSASRWTRSPWAWSSRSRWP